MAKQKPVEQLSRAMWRFLLYPDSMAAEFGGDIQKVWAALEDMLVPLMVSPLHDRDVREDGSIKKPHYHCLVVFDGPVPYNQVLGMFEQFGVKKLELTPSRKAAERYMCHLDSPAKAQYDLADLRFFGSFQAKFLGDRYEQNAISQIHEFIEEQGIVYYPDLSLQISRSYPDLLTALLRYSSHFNNYCYGRERLIKKASRGNDSYVNLTYSMTRFKIRSDE